MQRVILSMLMIFTMVATAHAGNPYFGVTAGTSVFQDTELEAEVGPGTADASFDQGHNFGADLGYDFGFMRAALEYGFKSNNLDTVEDAILPGVEVQYGGDVSIDSFMAAAYYDIKNSSKFTPYVGGGLGFAIININQAGEFGEVEINDSDGVFAYKAEGGFAYAVSNNLSLTAAYEYFGTADGSFKNILNEEFDANMESHSGKFGLRYAF